MLHPMIPASMLASRLVIASHDESKFRVELAGFRLVPFPHLRADHEAFVKQTDRRFFVLKLFRDPSGFLYNRTVASCKGLVTVQGSRDAHGEASSGGNGLELGWR